MKAKNLFKGILAHHIMRHRQHHRFLRNMGMQVRHFGPFRGLLVLGAIAMAGSYLQKRRTLTPEHLPRVDGGY